MRTPAPPQPPPPIPPRETPKSRPGRPRHRPRGGRPHRTRGGPRLRRHRPRRLRQLLRHPPARHLGPHHQHRHPRHKVTAAAQGKPVPTNDWWSSLAFQRYGDNPYSTPMCGHPHLPGDLRGPRHRLPHHPRHRRGRPPVRVRPQARPHPGAHRPQLARHQSRLLVRLDRHPVLVRRHPHPAGHHRPRPALRVRQGHRRAAHASPPPPRPPSSPTGATSSASPSPATTTPSSHPRRRLERLRLHDHRGPRRQGLLLARRPALHQRPDHVPEVRVQLRHRLPRRLVRHRRHRPRHLRAHHPAAGGHRDRHAAGPLPPPVAAHLRRAHPVHLRLAARRREGPRESRTCHHQPAGAPVLRRCPGRPARARPGCAATSTRS